MSVEMAVRPLVIACAALTADLRRVLVANALEQAFEITYLPANLHNSPQQITPAVESILASVDNVDRPTFVAYADCGTGGLLDAMLLRYPNAQRLDGAHCYEVFAGAEAFAAIQDAELGTFYLTDFLAKHFDALVWQGLGLDRAPQLRDVYFGAYRRVMLLSQSDDPAVIAAGRAAALRLGLRFEHHHVGRAGLAEPMQRWVALSIRKAA